MFSRRSFVIAVIPVVAAAAAPQAQTPAPPAVVAGWNEGFFLQTADGTHRLQLGGVVQTDGRFPLDDPSPVLETFVLRKARPVLAGRIARYFDFRLMPELAGSATILDAYFDIRFSPKFRLRSGKDKTPIGYELLLSDPTLVFPERSVVSLLVPSRDIGFQAQGEVAGGRVLYAGGVFNGNPTDAASSTTDTDTNDGKDVAGRIVYMPFRTTKGSRLTNLGFHLGASRGSQDGALPSFRTSIGQTFFGYATGAAAAGDRTRVTPAVFLYSGRFGGFAEYARSSAEVARNAVVTSVANQAWDVTATVVLTGEATSDRGVRPERAVRSGSRAVGCVTAHRTRRRAARRSRCNRRRPLRGRHGAAGAAVHRRRQLVPQQLRQGVRHLRAFHVRRRPRGGALDRLPQPARVLRIGA